MYCANGFGCMCTHHVRDERVLSALSTAPYTGRPPRERFFASAEGATPAPRRLPLRAICGVARGRAPGMSEMSRICVNIDQ